MPPRQVLALRVFISSPGDVLAERSLALSLLTGLSRQFNVRDDVSVKPVAWDDPLAPTPMALGQGAQTAVDVYKGRASECDLTIVMLWSRLGSVPAETRPDGSHYASGTAYEIESALGAGREVWIFRRGQKPQLDIDDPQYPEKLRQYRAVGDYLDSLGRAQVAASASPTVYTTPEDFGQKLEPMLRQFVNLRLRQQADAANAAALANTANTRPARLPMPSLRLPEYPFVGRRDLIGQLLAGLDAGHRNFAFVRMPGIGKTALAAQLLREPLLQQRFPDGALWAYLGKAPNADHQLKKWAAALGLDQAQVKSFGREEIGLALSEAVGDRRLLIIVDDVWTTEAAELFHIDGLHCARVYTTRFQGIVDELGVRELELRKLSPEDACELLGSVAPESAAVDPQALRRLAARVDGLPIALVLLGKMLRRRGHTREGIAAVIDSLGSLSDLLDQKNTLEFQQTEHLSLNDVIEASYTALGCGGMLNDDSLPGDLLRDAATALSVLRPDPAWFGAELAELLTQAPAAALDDLVDSGLIEAVQYEGRAAQNSRQRFTMHRVIAEQLRKRLPPERRRALNALAAQHFLGRLEALEQHFQAGGNTYRLMYRYEDQEWQHCQDNWLYYFAEADYSAEATRAFLQTWFDGFWWWSCFTADGFDFCDQLLREWEHRLELSSWDADATAADRIARSQHGLDLLRRFKKAYPKETEDRGSGDWAGVAASLGEIRRISGIAVELAQLSHPRLRRVRALTNIFMAEAARFGRGELAEAEPLYREALDLFRAAQDCWNVAWTLYHLGDMLSATPRHDEARALGREAAVLGEQGRDYEVAALAHRLLGDLALAEGDAHQALTDYDLAVALAYRFQVQPEDPDPYTIGFYAQTAAQVTERVLGATPLLADQMAAGLRQRWAARTSEPQAPRTPPPQAPLSATESELSASKGEALAARLFPPALPLARLKLDGLLYRDRVRADLGLPPVEPLVQGG